MPTKTFYDVIFQLNNMLDLDTVCHIVISIKGQQLPKLSLKTHKRDRDYSFSLTSTSRSKLKWAVLATSN